MKSLLTKVSSVLHLSLMVYVFPYQSLREHRNTFPDLNAYPYIESTFAVYHLSINDSYGLSNQISLLARALIHIKISAYVKIIRP